MEPYSRLDSFVSNLYKGPIRYCVTTMSEIGFFASYHSILLKGTFIKNCYEPPYHFVLSCTVKVNNWRDYRSGQVVKVLNNLPSFILDNLAKSLLH